MLTNRVFMKWGGAWMPLNWEKNEEKHTRDAGHPGGL
jgi:hypothetical protein